MAILRCATCGAKVKTEADRFTATCEYCGNEMTVFESSAEFEVDSRGLLVQYNGKGGDIVIPDGVKKIGDSAFKGNERIFSVSFPQTITEIGSRAFEGCTEMEEADLPDALETLGDHAFFKCSSLRRVKIPSGVFSIKQTTFSECRSLVSIELHDSIRTIADYAFDECSKLTNIAIPKRLRSLGKCAFQKCSSLTEIDLPDSLETLGGHCFSGCTNLRRVKLSASLEALGSFTFAQCTMLEAIHIPASVRKIECYCFSECTSLKSITFEEGILTIEDGTFYKCHALEGALHFPDSLLKIPGFPSCKVTKISVGKAIETYPAALCVAFPMLDSFIFRAPIGQIGDGLFKNLESLTELTLPDSVEQINEYAFSGCINLKKITLPKSLKRIGAYAFKGCKALNITAFPENLVEICRNAFRDCEGLVQCHFPGSLRRIGEDAFNGCVKLERIVFEEGCEVLEEYCFYNYSAKGLRRTAYLPSTIQKMGEDAVLGDYYYEEPTYIYSPQNAVIQEYCGKRRWIYWKYQPSATEMAAQKEAQRKAAQQERDTLLKQLAKLESRLNSENLAVDTYKARIQEKNRELEGYKGLFNSGKRKKAEAELRELENSRNGALNAVSTTQSQLRTLLSQIRTVDEKLK